jgi:FkbM family methyltransferase
MRRVLRGFRAALAAAIARLVLAFPSLESIVIRFGRAVARRSRVAAGLYWFVQERLLARLRTSGERYRSVVVQGRRLQLDVTDPTGRHPYFYGTPYEPGVTGAIVAALNSGDVFADVGANIGYFTVLAAAIVGDRGRVIAFEPHVQARDRLEATVERNGVSARVEIVPLALADADGHASLFVEDAVSAHSTLDPARSPMRHVATFRAAGEVRVTTFDGWIASHPELAGRLRCVKIDVEGVEARVLAGMTAALRLPGLAILCETTLGSDADRALAAAGFQWRRIEPGDASYGNFLYLRP